jgi:hypothetical protein
LRVSKLPSKNICTLTYTQAPQEQKGRNKMRTIIYGVKEMSTGKIVYVNYYQSECIKKIEELGEGYELCHQWRSF